MYQYVIVSHLGFMAQVMGTSVLYPEEPRMVMLWITTRPYVMLYGAEVVEPVLSSSRHLDKGIEYRMLHPWLGLGLVTRYVFSKYANFNLIDVAKYYCRLKLFTILAMRTNGDRVENYSHQHFITIFSRIFLTSSIVSRQFLFNVYSWSLVPSWVLLYLLCN